MGETIVSEYVAEKLTNLKFVHYWPMITRELDTVPHIWADRWTKESIYDFTLEGRFQCWGVGTEEVMKGVIFTQIATYPAASVLQALFAFGNDFTKGIEAFDAVAEKFALFNGCSRMEVVGREGWETKLRKVGFVRKSVVLVKELQPIRMN